MCTKLPSLFAYDAVFLDLDGLLVDSERLHFRAYETMLSNRGCRLGWDFLTFLSIAHQSATGLKETILKQFPCLKTPWERLYQEKTAAYLTLLKEGSVRWMKGAEQLLQELQKRAISHAIVTNSSKEQLLLIQDTLALLKMVPLSITREDYRFAKPHSDSYETAMRSLGISAKRAIGLEDSMRGIFALKGAGIQPLLVCPRYHPQMAHLTDKSLPHTESLLTLIA